MEMFREETRGEGGERDRVRTTERYTDPETRTSTNTEGQVRRMTDKDIGSDKHIQRPMDINIGRAHS